MGPIRTFALLTGAAAAFLVAGAGAANADSNAYGAAYDSPGVLSGNVVQVPIDVPVNVCGNSLNLVGLLNPSFGNRCSNGEGGYQDSGYHHGTFGSTEHQGWHPTGWNHQDGWNHDDSDCSDS
jgi:hypothetical protein